jgi:hypothetical protein
MSLSLRSVFQQPRQCYGMQHSMSELGLGQITQQTGRSWTEQDAYAPLPSLTHHDSSASSRTRQSTPPQCAGQEGSSATHNEVPHPPSKLPRHNKSSGLTPPSSTFAVVLAGDQTAATRLARMYRVISAQPSQAVKLH